MQGNPSAPRKMNYLMKSSKDGDTKYFVFTYDMPFGVHHPEALKHQLKNDPTAQKLMSQGYSQPDMISGIPDDIDAAIADQMKQAKNYEDKKSEFPMMYYPAIEAIKRYTQLKDLLSRVKLEK